MRVSLRKLTLCLAISILLSFVIMVNVAFAFTTVHNGGFYSPSSSSGVTGGYCQMQTNSQPYATADYFSMAWVLCLGPATSKYAQVGWVKGGTDPGGIQYTDTRYFFEWSNSSTDWNRVRSTTGPAIGSRHSYKVEFSGTTVTGKVDEANIGSKTLSWSSIYQVQFCTERDMGNFDGGSFFPGKISNHDYFDFPQYKLNGAWTPIKSMTIWEYSDSYAGQDHTTYFNNTYNYRFDVWDKRVN